MRDRLYLAWRYLAHHRIKTAILVTSITLILFLPFGLRALGRQGEARLTARAAATPLLIGAKGSPTELVLNSLYFGADVPEAMSYAEVARIAATGFAQPIPLYVRFRAGDDPIVGTTVDYFRFRGLRVAAGAMMGRLGECVLGSRAAERRGVGPGDTVMSSPESVFDLAGVYPLRMRVAGVLAHSDGPDDDAVFVDVKTAWIIGGLAHGHEDLTRAAADGRVLERKEGEVVGNASVVEFNEVTDANIDSFHFHGDLAGYPLTAVIAVPPDAKRAALLRGRYLAPDERHQALTPDSVMDELLATILTVQSFVVAAMAVVGGATLATAALVFWLSLRLRRREIATMRRIGGSRGAIAWVMASEIALVLLAGAILAALLTWVTSAFGAEVVRALLR